MTDQWVPAPPQPPPPDPPPGLPPANTWAAAEPCAATDSPSIVGSIIITDVPATIVAPYAWGITLNDGSSPPNFAIDHYDASGALIESPIVIDGSSGDVMLTHDPTEDLGAATKHYVDANAAGLTDAPGDGAFYGRKSLAWANPSHSDITDWASALAPYALLVNVPAASASLPIMDGTAVAGSSAAFARGDHVHPSDTSRYAASNPAGYQTAAQVTASLAPYALTASVPAASTTTPAMDGTAAVGTGATFARADHVHPSDTSRAPLASPVFTGNPTAPTPTAGDNDTSVATTAFVTTAVAAQPVAIGDNRIINGDMRIDQRNNGAGGTAIGVYTVDRWYYNATAAAKGTWQRALGVGAVPVGFQYCLGFTASSAYTPATGDIFEFFQQIEADFISDFGFGTAAAQPVTLSFWAQSSLTGTFSGSLRNGARSYPFTYSLPAASTWTKIVLTIPGDTAGTWALSGNGAGVLVGFSLGAGATYSAPANAWAATGNGTHATGSVNVVSTNAATFNVTGVKLEVGSVATPFNRQSLAKSQADCERYFRWTPFGMHTYIAAAGGGLSYSYTWNAMRAAPTLVGPTADPNLTQTLTNVASFSMDSQTPYGCRAYVTATAIGSILAIGYRFSASAEL